MATTGLDHLIVAAPSLREGAQYIGDTLGLKMELGGQHPRLGPENALLKLGDKLFLRVIAADPSIPTPCSTRWLQPGDPPRQPRLLSWVARTPDIRAAVSSAPALYATTERIWEHRYELEIAVTTDGRLPISGVAPQSSSAVHNILATSYRVSDVGFFCLSSTIKSQGRRAYSLCSMPWASRATWSRPPPHPSTAGPH